MSGTTVALTLIQSAVDALKGHELHLVRRNRFGIDHTDGRWTASGTKVCLCGAIAFVLQPSDHGNILAAVARKLGVRERDARALSDGFEWERGEDPTWPHDRQYMYWFRVGKRFGRRTPREALA